MSDSERKRAAAVVLAAGKGKRMGTAVQKQFLELAGKPVLFYALKAFEESSVEDVILVTGAESIEYCRKDIVEKYGLTKVRSVISGGKERFHSVLCGLEELAAFADAPDIVMIHDGARPFVTPQLIDGLLDETKRYPACVTATKVKDTIKVADAEGFCVTTPKRDTLWAVQTPQSFDFSLILSAYRQLPSQEEKLLSQGVSITDDAQICELFSGKKVKLIEGDYLNNKLTTAEDLLLSERILELVSSKYG